MRAGRLCGGHPAAFALRADTGREPVAGAPGCDIASDRAARNADAGDACHAVARLSNSGGDAAGYPLGDRLDMEQDECAGDAEQQEGGDVAELQLRLAARRSIFVSSGSMAAIRNAAMT